MRWVPLNAAMRTKPTLFGVSAEAMYHSFLDDALSNVIRDPVRVGPSVGDRKYLLSSGAGGRRNHPISSGAVREASAVLDARSDVVTCPPGPSLRPGYIEPGHVFRSHPVAHIVGASSALHRPTKSVLISIDHQIGIPNCRPISFCHHRQENPAGWLLQWLYTPKAPEGKA